jgi:hypothetical protein
MKTKTLFRAIALLIIGIVLNDNLSAQEKKEEYRIKIIKYENGKKEKIDTTFNNKEDFEAFHKTQVANHEYYDMLSHKKVNGKIKDCPGMNKKKDCPFSMQFDSLTGKHVKVVRMELDENEKEMLLNEDDEIMLLEKLDIDLDSVITEKNVKVKVIKIYRKIEIIDAPESAIEQSQHPQMKAAVNDEKLTLKNIKAYPNPSAGSLTIEIETEDKGKIDLLVTDIQGKEVLKESFTPSSTKISKTINMEGAESGVYLLKVTSKGKSVVKKLIIEN